MSLLGGLFDYHHHQQVRKRFKDGLLRQAAMGWTGTSGYFHEKLQAETEPTFHEKLQAEIKEWLPDLTS